MQARKYMVLLVAMVLVLTGCEKWLDVKPKTQVDADLLYQRESGYKDVLTGAYVNMSSTDMYGRELTFGFVDVVGNVYPNSSGNYNYIRNFDFTSIRQVEAKVAGMWSRTYNTLSNLNNLIARLRTAGPDMFQADNYNVILGESLGLRAYLHFDMLRLFAPSFKANAAASSIPYVSVYGYNPSAIGTVAAVLDSVLADLKASAELLQLSDPIKTGRVITASIDNGYLLNRNFHMNYFAVKATMARVYLYKSDLVNAASCADEVINSAKFSWIKQDAIANLNEAQRDRSFTPEQVLVLDVPKIADNLIDAESTLFFTSPYINSLYSFANDWRKLYLWSPELGASPNRYCIKLQQPENIPDNLGRRMPLIRLPELYLISAEAAFDTDVEKARVRINDLRKNRGFDVLIPAGTTAATLRNELLLEYRREFIGEGVMFYYYKRLDADKMEGGATTFTKQKYVIPIPVDETQFR